MTPHDYATEERQRFLARENGHETKLESAIAWLRERGIYRGDVRCEHRYTPALPILPPEHYR